MRAAAFFLLVGLLGIELYRDAHAIKPGACMAELEQARTDLRLRTAELLVARGQLRACEKRTP